MLEQIHMSGYVYNDLKLDNLMTDHNCKLPRESKGENVFEDVKLTIIDFGFATKYVQLGQGENKKTVHKPKSEVDVFRGNMVFSSTNQL